MRLLETSGLTKKFGGLTVMNDLDFYIEEGEIKGFLGPILGAIVVSVVQNLANLLTSLSGSSNSEAFISFSRWLGSNSSYTPFLTAAVLLIVLVVLLIRKLVKKPRRRAA